MSAPQFFKFYAVSRSWRFNALETFEKTLRSPRGCPNFPRRKMGSLEEDPAFYMRLSWGICNYDASAFRPTALSELDMKTYMYFQLTAGVAEVHRAVLRIMCTRTKYLFKSPLRSESGDTEPRVLHTLS
ncbi:hypothetical protein CC1G_02179 [Coprinopsis cinerea okayama7|uniref:Uncharacterized protein n=1 Tax=Coprinopsis cinerea (strain Okayama-7 / 130 / ATCC MYA-4618 / FGSC 9003) TaxID=240176 RepID=A8NKG5_COPC7|nr:hypothetical protein CC1G_02179 [Coprinopsis cinerea okayama7\|eukprot:XP_001834443.2 hypothetical protein CC1G_02179 [Coprinopsis cinerea okayama7\